MVNEDKNMIDDIMNDNDLSREEKYNMLENMGIEPRQILDNEEEATAYQLADGTYAIVQAGKGFGGDLECKCCLPEHSCAICNPIESANLGYPPMPSYKCSPDYFEMWEGF